MPLSKNLENLQDHFFIHLSVGFGKIVRMLIEKEAVINAVDKDYTSALIYAASNGNISLASTRNNEKFTRFIIDSRTS